MTEKPGQTRGQALWRYGVVHILNRTGHPAIARLGRCPHPDSQEGLAMLWPDSSRRLIQMRTLLFQIHARRRQQATKMLLQAWAWTKTSPRCTMRRDDSHFALHRLLGGRGGSGAREHAGWSARRINSSATKVCRARCQNPLSPGRKQRGKQRVLARCSCRTRPRCRSRCHGTRRRTLPWHSQASMAPKVSDFRNSLVFRNRGHVLPRC